MQFDWKLRLREHKAVRVLVYPWKQWEIARVKSRFARSANVERLQRFHGIYEGKRCFIIGNGPSLTVEDLELLKDEITFAANRIYRMYEQTDWRPTFWMCVDPYILESDKDKIAKLPGIKFVSNQIEHAGIDAGEELYWIYNHQPYRINKYSDRIRVKFSEDVSKVFEAGETVTYNAIQFAVYMGFKEIYLLGVDHSYSQRMDSKGRLQIDRSIKDYFGDVKTEKFNIQNYTVSTEAYRSALAYANAHGIQIFNATRGGKLDVFPRISLDAVVAQHKQN